MTENRTVSNAAMGSDEGASMRGGNPREGKGAAASGSPVPVTPEGKFDCSDRPAAATPAREGKGAAATPACEGNPREGATVTVGSAFHNLRAERKRLNLLVKPTGFVSGMAMDNPGFQMNHSVKLLEQELADTDEPRVLQLFLRGSDQKNPDAWELFADGAMVASGTGDFARECFEQSATQFLDLCRKAVAQNAKPSFGKPGYELLQAAKLVAQVEARTVARDEGRLAALAALSRAR